MERNLYIYEGEVTSFGKVIHDKFRGGSLAVSPAKALSNIAFSYKRKYKLAPNCKIELNPKCLRIEKSL